MASESLRPNQRDAVNIRKLLCFDADLSIRDDRELGDLWGVDGIHDSDDTHPYEKTFAPFLGNQTFETLIKQEKEQGKPTNVLDLFGGGYFIKDTSSTDNVVGFRLVDMDNWLLTQVKRVITKEQDPLKRQKLVKKERYYTSLNEDKKREVVEANIYDGKSWKKLRECMGRRQIMSFNLIVCRPKGAFEERNTTVSRYSKDSHKTVFVQMLKNAYDLLASGGMLFSEIPEMFSDLSVQNIEEQLKNLGFFGTNIHTSTDTHEKRSINVLKIIK